jgi:hypothetical protein
MVFHFSHVHKCLYLRLDDHRWGRYRPEIQDLDRRMCLEENPGVPRAAVVQPETIAQIQVDKTFVWAPAICKECSVTDLIAGGNA